MVAAGGGLARAPHRHPAAASRQRGRGRQGPWHPVHFRSARCPTASPGCVDCWQDVLGATAAFQHGSKEEQYLVHELPGPQLRSRVRHPWCVCDGDAVELALHDELVGAAQAVLGLVPALLRVRAHNWLRVRLLRRLKRASCISLRQRARGDGGTDEVDLPDPASQAHQPCSSELQASHSPASGWQLSRTHTEPGRG